MTTSSKAKRFDYAAAWRDLIGPVLKDLHPGALAIYRELRDASEFDNLAQGPDLDIPMPSTLRADFTAIPSDDLAYAARVLYFCGHWASGGRGLDADCAPGRADARGRDPGRCRANFPDSSTQTSKGLYDLPSLERRLLSYRM